MVDFSFPVLLVTFFAEFCLISWAGVTYIMYSTEHIYTAITKCEHSVCGKVDVGGLKFHALTHVHVL